MNGHRIIHKLNFQRGRIYAAWNESGVAEKAAIAEAYFSATHLC